MDQQWWSILAILLYGVMIVGGLVLGLIIWNVEMKRIDNSRPRMTVKGNSTIHETEKIEGWPEVLQRKMDDDAFWKALAELDDDARGRL